MTWVHLYPFLPYGAHGGTQRLRMALEATGPESVLFYFDSSRDLWLGPVTADGVGDVATSQALRSRGRKLKRRIFPSTLWESGWRAMAAFDPAACASSSAVVVHTTYIAKLGASLRKVGTRTVADVYDLVWRAHAIDAAAGDVLTSTARRTYSSLVRLREERWIRANVEAVFAGWSDYMDRPDRVRAAWVPNGVTLDEAVPAPASNGKMHVGFLGNFAHQSTMDSARSLLQSPLARSERVHIVLAGTGSERLTAAPNVSVLGPVSAPDDFYREVNCVVVPVTSGTGIKAKLAEGVLAGRPVVTTPLGAAGFPPDLQRHLAIIPDAASLSYEVVARSVDALDALEARRVFADVFGWRAAVAAYANALSLP